MRPISTDQNSTIFQQKYSAKFASPFSSMALFIQEGNRLRGKPEETPGIWSFNVKYFVKENKMFTFLSNIGCSVHL